MNVRALLLAAVFAAVGVVALFIYMRRVEIEASGGDKVSVLMLVKPVKKGAPVTEAHLALRDVPMAYVDDRAIRASDRPKVLGVRTDRDIEPQQILQWGDLAVSGKEVRHLGQLVQPGARALTLRVPSNHTSIDLLRPGDFVDVIGVFEEGRGQSSVVLLQKVLVLAVNEDTLPYQDSRRGQRGDQLLTLSVTLQESQLVTLAALRGPITAVLRSPDDTSVTDKIPSLSQVINRETVPTPTGVAQPPPSSRGRPTHVRPERPMEGPTARR